MYLNSLLRFSFVPVVLGLFAGLADAQDPDFNATLLSRWDPTNDYADVWGDGDFLYMAHYNVDKISILDISDPFNPTVASTIVVGGSNAGASAQDVKVGDGLLFVALEGSNPDGALIIDVRDPFSPIILTTVDPEPGSFEQIHNVFYDSGWLYLVNSTDNTLAIVDLRTYDPDNAPGTMGSIAYKVSNIGGAFVHDITVQNGRLYCSAWDSLYVYDVSNLGQQAPRLIGTTPGGNCHAAWATEDGAFIITGDETKGGAIRLFEVLPNGSNIDLLQQDSYILPVATSFSAHNMIVKGERVYVSWYQAGVLVMEINRETKSFDWVAQYDPFGGVVFGGFNGVWGVYPLLGEETVLVSDLYTGAYIVDMSALEVTMPALPTTIPSGTALTFDFGVAGLGNSIPDANAVSVLCSVDGSPFVAEPALFLGGDQFQITLPATGCQGELEFYVAVTDTLGRTFYDPGVAPAKLHKVYTTDSLVSVFSDDFETNQGWSVFGDAVTGNFVRVTPLGTHSKAGQDDPLGVGTMCFVTGQGIASGANAHLYDLDNGTTSITSPTFDMSAGDGLIRYATNFFNRVPDNDQVLVEISNDAGATWAVLEIIMDGSGGWRHSVRRVSNAIQPTAQMKVRFTTSDIGNNSTTDLAIDEFHADVFSCDTTASVTPRNGSGLNPSCLTSSNLPVLGTNWAASVDSSAQPSASLAYLVSYQNPTSGVFLNAGELLLDVSSSFFFSSVVGVDANGQSVHVVAWPNDPNLVGVSTSVQAVLFGGGAQLCNALDLLLDQ